MEITLTNENFEEEVLNSDVPLGCMVHALQNACSDCRGTGK